jgi:hypothetical protein
MGLQGAADADATQPELTTDCPGLCGADLLKQTVRLDEKLNLSVCSLTVASKIMRYRLKKWKTLTGVSSPASALIQTRTATRMTRRAKQQTAVKEEDRPQTQNAEVSPYEVRPTSDFEAPRAF